MDEVMRYQVPFLCFGCGQVVPGEVEVLDAGTILVCPLCQAETVVDLFTPIERRGLYAAKGAMEDLPLEDFRIMFHELDKGAPTPGGLVDGLQALYDWLDRSSTLLMDADHPKSAGGVEYGRVDLAKVPS